MRIYVHLMRMCCFTMVFSTFILRRWRFISSSLVQPFLGRKSYLHTYTPGQADERMPTAVRSIQTHSPINRRETHRGSYMHNTQQYHDITKHIHVPATKYNCVCMRSRLAGIVKAARLCAFHEIQTDDSLTIFVVVVVVSFIRISFSNRHRLYSKWGNNQAHQMTYESFQMNFV